MRARLRVWPQAVHQQCVVHVVRASLRYTNRKAWQKIIPALREICTAPAVTAAEARFEAFAAEFGDPCPGPAVCLLGVVVANGPLAWIEVLHDGDLSVPAGMMTPQHPVQGLSKNFTPETSTRACPQLHLMSCFQSDLVGQAGSVGSLIDEGEAPGRTASGAVLRTVAMAADAAGWPR
ncbi:transposase [Micromonospora haikouensis]|uniref:transposase n=1 Tax=Micromonospora haikouensis TaxID=686309 RepID=UPI003D733DBD